jgi:hypothetical protein
MNKYQNRHNVSITGKVYTRLKSHGIFGESFNDLLNRLVDEIEEKGVDKE